MKKTPVAFALSVILVLLAACSRNEPIRKTSRPISEADAPAGHGSPAKGPPAKSPGMPGAHPPIAAAPEIEITGIEKAEGGQTVAGLFAGKADLAGKGVMVRGQVVKFSPRIMGKNWLHIRDGSGDAAAGTNDLTVTTNIVAKPGDIVTVSGKLAVDKDFGYGYKYGVMIEDAKVTASNEADAKAPVTKEADAK